MPLSLPPLQYKQEMTLRSMTAFALAEREIGAWVFTWELRSVNHRYLDTALRLPDSFRFVEGDARTRIAAVLKRGRIEAALVLKRREAQAEGLPVNLELAASLLAAASRIETLSGRELSRFSALDVLRWPGVINEAEVDRETLAPGLLALLDEALAELVRVRETEGRQLALLIASRCSQMREIVAGVRLRLPEVLAAMREKLKLRVTELAAKADEDRLEQEMVYLAQKWDVAEELDRLESHLTEVERAIEQQDATGRRLDFLMQEMNREANTLGSKSADTETTRASVELKVLIEQIREQVQNVE